MIDRRRKENTTPERRAELAAKTLATKRRLWVAGHLPKPVVPSTLIEWTADMDRVILDADAKPSRYKGWLRVARKVGVCEKTLQRRREALGLVVRRPKKKAPRGALKEKSNGAAYEGGTKS